MIIYLRGDWALLRRYPFLFVWSRDLLSDSVVNFFIKIDLWVDFLLKGWLVAFLLVCKGFMSHSVTYAIFSKVYWSSKLSLTK